MIPYDCGKWTFALGLVKPTVERPPLWSRKGNLFRRNRKIRTACTVRVDFPAGILLRGGRVGHNQKYEQNHKLHEIWAVIVTCPREMGESELPEGMMYYR